MNIAPIPQLDFIALERSYGQKGGVEGILALSEFFAGHGLNLSYHVIVGRFTVLGSGYLPNQAIEAITRNAKTVLATQTRAYRFEHNFEHSLRTQNETLHFGLTRGEAEDSQQGLLTSRGMSISPGGSFRHEQMFGSFR